MVSVFQVTEQAGGAHATLLGKASGSKEWSPAHVGSGCYLRPGCSLGPQQGQQGGVLPGQGCTSVPSGTLSRRT